MRALMLAMAMQESTHMDVRERDASKDDHTDKAAKATIFNLSVVSATPEHKSHHYFSWGQGPCQPRRTT
jgi:hypothetical protein